MRGDELTTEVTEGKLQRRRRPGKKYKPHRKYDRRFAREGTVWRLVKERSPMTSIDAETNFKPIINIT